MPLITRRSSTRALPRVSVGRCGLIFENCAFVSQNWSRLIYASFSEAVNHATTLVPTLLWVQTLVFIAFFMQTMVPLRYVAIASNITFIVWSQALNIWPVLVLHTALLPLNVIRLVQIKRMLSRIETARGTGLDLSVLAVGLRAERHVAGTVLFA